MLTIIKSVQAEQDLINIWSYSYKEWGDDQADYYLDLLNDGFKLIANNPGMCRLRKEFIKPIYLHMCEHHLIIYIFNKAELNIVRVLHESMNIEIQLS